MARCLVLGGNGFLGSHIAERLIQDNHIVRVFDTFSHGMQNLDSFRNQIEIFKGNFLHEPDLLAALEDIDIVFHYISTTNSVTSLKDPRYEVESNIIGSIRLFQNSVKAGVKKIIFPSSGGTIYGEPTTIPISEEALANPRNPYAISKLAIEKYLNFFYYTYGLDYVVLRYSNPYGERQNLAGSQGVIPIFLNKIKNGETPIIYGDGCAIRDYIYIKDAIDATLILFNRNCDDKIFNIGSGKGKSVNELIAIMAEVTGREITPQYYDDAGVYIQKIVLDITKVKTLTGWSPQTDIVDGIRHTWDWINR